SRCRRSRAAPSSRCSPPPGHHPPSPPTSPCRSPRRAPPGCRRACPRTPTRRTRLRHGYWVRSTPWKRGRSCACTPTASFASAGRRRARCCSASPATNNIVRAFDLRTMLFGVAGDVERSEEHTSELQSRGHLVCRLLLEKKKKKK